MLPLLGVRSGYLRGFTASVDALLEHKARDILVSVLDQNIVYDCSRALGTGAYMKDIGVRTFRFS
jgi:hypothetical protein